MILTSLWCRCTLQEQVVGHLVELKENDDEEEGRKMMVKRKGKGSEEYGLEDLLEAEEKKDDPDFDDIIGEQVRVGKINLKG